MSDPAPPEPPRLPPRLQRFEGTELPFGEGLEDTELVTHDLSMADEGPLDLSSCELRDVRLTAAHLEDSAWRDVRLVDCEMSGTDLSRTNWRRVELVNCRMSALTSPDARWADVSLRGCRLDEASLRFAQGERVRFDDCVLQGADLTGAKFPEAVLTNCDLRRAQLSKATLRGSDLSGSLLDDIKGALALKGVRLRSDQIVGVALGLFAELDITIADLGGR